MNQITGTWQRDLRERAKFSSAALYPLGQLETLINLGYEIVQVDQVRGKKLLKSQIYRKIPDQKRHQCFTIHVNLMTMDHHKIVFIKT